MIRRAAVLKILIAQRGAKEDRATRKGKLPGWNRVERYDPEGSRGPGGERRLEDRRGVWRSNLATGFVR